MTAPTPASFLAANTARLRAAGLAGKTVTVAASDRALELAGAEGGTLRLELARIERLRLGYFQGKHRRVFRLGLDLVGEAKPLALEPPADAARAYGVAMRRFAAVYAASRGLGRIETGIGGAAAAAMLAFLMLPPVALVAVAYLYAPNALVAAGMFAVAALLAASGVWLYARRQRPRPIASLDALEPQLPDPATGA